MVKLGSTLESSRKDGRLANSDNIYDKISGKMQEEINQEVSALSPVDEEDLTRSFNDNGHSVTKFADRSYSPQNFSGKGYKILRKNIKPVSLAITEIVVSSVPTSDGYLAFIINGVESHVDVIASTDTTTDKVAEKITTKLKDTMPEYDVSKSASTITLTRKFGGIVSTPSSFSAVGTGALCSVEDYSKIELRNLLTAVMLSEANTIYEIRYDFDLDGEELVIPINCTLQFNGGKLCNGTLQGANTEISASIYHIFYNISFKGSFKEDCSYPEWFGAKGDLIIGTNNDANALVNIETATNDTAAFQKSIDFSDKIVATSNYKVTSIEVPNNKDLCFNHIAGNIEISGSKNKLSGLGIHGEKPLVLGKGVGNFCSNNEIDVRYIYNTLRTEGDCVLLDGSYNMVMNNIFKNVQTNRGAYGYRMIAGKGNYKEEFGNKLIGCCNQNILMCCVSTNARKSAILMQNDDISNTSGACMNGGRYFNFDPETSYKVLVMKGSVLHHHFYGLRLNEFSGSYKKDNQFNDNSLEGTFVGKGIICFDEKINDITFDNTFCFDNFSYIGEENAKFYGINWGVIKIGGLTTKTGSFIFGNSKVGYKDNNVRICPNETLKINKVNVASDGEIMNDGNINPSLNFFYSTNSTSLKDRKKITINLNSYGYWGINDLYFQALENKFPPILVYKGTEFKFTNTIQPYERLYHVRFDNLGGVTIMKSDCTSKSVAKLQNIDSGISDNRRYAETSLYYDSQTREIIYYAGVELNWITTDGISTNAKKTGMTKDRPTSNLIKIGFLFKNTETNKWEIFNGSSWENLDGTQIIDVTQ